VKQKDIALIIVIVFVSATLSFFLSNALIGTPQNKKQKAAVVEPITSDFHEPNKKFFNETAVNPTQTITIGDSSNQQPFRDN
jgi:hypothetical protein